MIRIASAEPTVFFKRIKNELKQLVRLTLTNSGSAAVVRLKSCLHGALGQEQTLSVSPGQSYHDVTVPDVVQQCAASFVIEAEGRHCVGLDILLKPQRKWTVHVVQLSHHDPGYTDLPSLVLQEHDRLLDEAIDIAARTESFPDDAKFRIVIEQAWSIDHFLKHMPHDRVAKIVELMRAGRFELTALFGNMTTELCGHETLARTAYHAFAIKRKYGIPIVSAEHNDITGISWGLSRVLTDAGIKLFCPGIPLYYDWGRDIGMQSFWDQQGIFGHDGPGAFWWESPTGKKVLFWCGNSGCGGSYYSTLPGLEQKLKLFEEQGYSWPVIRWPVGGGARDNSPYIEGYANTIKEWNEQWAYPRLICSTNAKFYEDFSQQDLSSLPVWKGELPGQDYPSGATSTAAATAANRNAHSSLLSAEKLASAAALHTDYRYPQDTLSEAYEETLWHDEHAWGFHFPCGPAMRASQHEKELHAYRAEALAHGVANKAMARIADSLRLEEGYHLVVFNSTSWSCTAPVRAPLRELDNSGSVMHAVPPEKDAMGIGYLKGVLLGNRFHTILPQEMVEGNFRLVNVETGRVVKHQIIEINSPMEPHPYAAERLGIGSGTKRYGFFEKPVGLKRDLCFVAEDVPAMGYRAYRLVPADEPQQTAAQAQLDAIENEYYHVSVDATGSIASIFDKEAQRELVDDSSGHGFFRLLVRQGNSPEVLMDECKGVEVKSGAVLSSITMTARAYGHPAIVKTVTLNQGVRKIYFDMKVLKDSTPLLNVHVGFPFAAKEPKFRYEGSLSVMNPIRDYLPGSYSDTVAVQNWVKVKDGSYSIVWSSLDAPMAGFSRLWPGYVSPAHRCILDESVKHPPQTEAYLNKGWVYSQLFNNNFGTNFSVSQCGEALFRYALTTTKCDVTDAEAARFGWQAAMPLEKILTDRGTPGNSLPPSGSFLEIDNSNVAMVNLKRAEDGRGFILRLWNMGGVVEHATLTFSRVHRLEAIKTNLCEEDTGELLSCIGNTVVLEFQAADVCTLRITGL